MKAINGRTPFCWVLALAILPLPLAACGSTGGNAAAVTSEAGLKVIPVTVTQNGKAHVFSTEVAATPEQQEQGLMYRKALAPDAAMLFPFPQPKYASFWMKNTLIPLDIVYVRSDGTIDKIAENTVPMSEVPVASGGEVAAVLELAGGTAERLGIDEGATVSWTLPTP